ncbi:hypothetical protein Taro_016920 [Colocasia esculenta]|uniref:Uncharacterized protein n=1 Tax=Colocasia esculenta TaxID=4460 RepID=A0A843UXT0_COLES|nr:hypothetical protein [Colocasia esculenta]
MIDSIGEAGPGLKAPTPKEIYGKYFEEGLTEIKDWVASFKLIEPLVQVLRMVDGEDKNDMGYLYEAMDKAKERLREKHPMAYQKWWRIIDARWESTLHHDLHAAGEWWVMLDYKTGQRNPFARIAIRVLS